MLSVKIDVVFEDA